MSLVWSNGGADLRLLLLPEGEVVQQFELSADESVDVSTS